MNTVEKMRDALKTVVDDAPGGKSTFYEGDSAWNEGYNAALFDQGVIARTALSALTEPTTEEMEFRAKFRNSDLESRASELHLAVMLYARRPVREYLAAIDAAVLQKIGRALSVLAVKECNMGLSEADEKRREKLATQAATVAAWYGLTVAAHGDPRGYVLRLHGEGVERNGMGDGFGVA